jgi:lambda family phage portal protein
MAFPLDVRRNALDKLVEVFSPSAGVRRLRDRIILRAYEAASPRDPWRPRRGTAGPNADHLADASPLRAKARWLDQNVPYIAAALDAKTANVCGTGIVPRATGEHAVTLNKLHREWVDVCDADGKLDLYGLIALGYRTGSRDGEALIRLRPRRLEDRLPVPLQLQLLEIDYLDTARNSFSSLGGGTDGVPKGNVVIEGIEYDGIGRVAAYWLFPQHPGETLMWRNLGVRSRRVPAASIIHLYKVRRPGQGRGISDLAAIITRTRDTQLLEDAELARKNLESRLGVLFSGDVSQQAAPLQNGGSATQGDPALARRTGDLGQLPSGGVMELPAGGGSFHTVAPNAAPGHVDNIKHHHHIITAALGVSYESATGDMREVNFSSARVRQLDVRRLAEQEQWLYLIPRLCRPVHRAFVDAAFDAGKVPSVDYACDFATPKWDYVNPMQESAADANDVATGQSSLSEKIRRRGYEPKAVFEELASDFKTLRDSGVLDILMFMQKGKLPEADDDGDASDADAKKTTARK